MHRTCDVGVQVNNWERTDAWFESFTCQCLEWLCSGHFIRCEPFSKSTRQRVIHATICHPQPRPSRRSVTGDETWVRHSTPKSKHASMEWMKASELAMSQEIHAVCWQSDDYCFFFFKYQKGVLLIYFPIREAVVYDATLGRLQATIRHRRPGLLTKVCCSSMITLTHTR